MALAFCLVIRLLGYQLWSTSCFSPVGSSMAGSEQGDERRHMGSGLGWAGAYRAPGWYHLDTLGFSGLMTSLAVPFTVSLLGRVIFGGCMTCLLCLFLFSHFVWEIVTVVCRYQWAGFCRGAFCGKQIHCCIFITDIICVEEKKGCVYGEELALIAFFRLIYTHKSQPQSYTRFELRAGSNTCVRSDHLNPSLLHTCSNSTQSGWLMLILQLASKLQWLNWREGRKLQNLSVQETIQSCTG